MRTTLLLLADLSYHYGIIGLNEYKDRLSTIEWLEPSDTCSDDKLPEYNDEETSKQESTVTQAEEQGDNLSLVVLKHWVFTIGDADCFPSVPHGHLKRKTAKPKLNPYTGFTYDKNNKEDGRLSKNEMVTLWNNQNFREHCRDQINWYVDFAPGYIFPNARKGIHLLPRWRRQKSHKKWFKSYG